MPCITLPCEETPGMMRMNVCHHQPSHLFGANQGDDKVLCLDNKLVTRVQAEECVL